MELFKMTCEEIQKIKDDTLEKLITYNRNLKLNYSSIKENVCHAKETQLKKTQSFV